MSFFVCYGYLNFERSCEACALLKTVAVPPPAIALATEVTVSPIEPELTTGKPELEEDIALNFNVFRDQVGVVFSIKY
jgi:hypothetical protein